MGMITGKTITGLRAAGIVAVVLALSACTPVTRYHGFAPTADELAAVQVGQSTRDSVTAIFGPPTAEGVLGNNDYYYVSSTFRHYGPFAPKELERQVLVFSFDQGAVVRNLARYTLEDGQVVVLERQVTEDGINDVTFIAQLLGAFGRVDAGALLGDAP